MFNFLKNKLSSIYSKFTIKVSSLFSTSAQGNAFYKELEGLMIKSDIGVTTTRNLITALQSNTQPSLKSFGGQAAGKSNEDIIQILKAELLTLLTKQPQPTIHDIILLIGINGSGKTTAAGKLTALYHAQGKKVLLVAGDTFRAAATEQLTEWAKKTNADIVVGKPGQDPASVIFDGCERFKNGNYDVLIIDTAGRLQTKINLMKELEKIKRIITKQLPDKQVTTLLTLDAMLGQNSFEQAQLFKETTPIDGIILTKMDGTGKGGIIFSIADQIHIPVAFISFGEQTETLQLFDPKLFVDEFIS